MFHKLKGFVLHIDASLFKEVMLLALPVIISNISRVFMHITDTAMVGHLGKNELVAVAMSGMIVWIAISVGIGFRIATQSIAARRVGQGEQRAPSKKDARLTPGRKVCQAAASSCWRGLSSRLGGRALGLHQATVV